MRGQKEILRFPSNRSGGSQDLLQEANNLFFSKGADDLNSRVWANKRGSWQNRRTPKQENIDKKGKSGNIWPRDLNRPAVLFVLFV